METPGSRSRLKLRVNDLCLLFDLHPHPISLCRTCCGGCSGLLTPSRTINSEPSPTPTLACPIHPVIVCPQPPTPPQFSASSASFMPCSCSWSFKGSTWSTERFLGLSALPSLSDPKSHFLCSSHKCLLTGTFISFPSQVLPYSHLCTSSCSSYLV